MSEQEQGLSPQTVLLLEHLIASSAQAKAGTASLEELVLYLCGRLAAQDAERVTTALTRSHDLRTQMIAVRQALDSIQVRPLAELEAVRAEGGAASAVVDTWLQVLSRHASEAASWWMSAQMLRSAARLGRRSAVYRDGESTDIEASVDHQGTLTLHASTPFPDGASVDVLYGDVLVGQAQVVAGRAELRKEGFGEATDLPAGVLPSSYFSLRQSSTEPALPVDIVSEVNAEGERAIVLDGRPSLEAAMLKLPLRINGTPADSGKAIHLKVVIAPGEAQLLQELHLPAEPTNLIVNIDLPPTLRPQHPYALFATFQEQDY